MIEWVKQSKYCELTGETPGSVKAKRRAGHFVDGVHCKVAPDGNIWINTGEVTKWIKNGSAATAATLSCHAD